MTYGFHRQGQSAEFPEKRKIALRPLDVSPYLPSLVSRTGSYCIEIIRDKLLSPVRLVDLFRPPVEICSLSDPIGVAAKRMHDGSFSQVPVYSAPVPRTPCLTAWANSGKSGRASRERALRRMAIRPARLEPLGLSAYGRERMVNGRAAASGERRIDLSEELPVSVIY